MSYSATQAIEQYKSDIKTGLLLSAVFGLLSVWFLLASVGAWWSAVAPGLRPEGATAQIVYSVVFGLIFVVLAFFTMLMVIATGNEWYQLRRWQNMR